MTSDFVNSRREVWKMRAPDGTIVICSIKQEARGFEVFLENEDGSDAQLTHHVATLLRANGIAEQWRATHINKGFDELPS